MNRLTSLAVLAVVLAGCSGNKVNPDHDAGNLDVPPPPGLGAQIDRLGRPAISTMLIGLLATSMAAQAARKDAYNHAPDPATWKATMLETGLTIERELALNLAVFDALDRGLMAISQSGCGNALQYSGPPSLTSYQGAAGLFADDQLYVDTSKTTCAVYLALEIEQVSAGSSIHTSCGGRTLTHDAIDVTYSVLAAGTDGLDKANGFGPKIVDGVPPHTDVKDTFPFLGAPH
jgi:hypothetical protein